MNLQPLESIVVGITVNVHSTSQTVDIWGNERSPVAAVTPGTRAMPRVRPTVLRQGFDLSNTPAPQLCPSSVWPLEELGRDFHLAVVSVAAHSSQALVESVKGRCFEGLGYSDFASASPSEGPRSQPGCC